MRALTLASLLGVNLRIAFGKLAGARPRPYKVLLELTEKCNSRCVHCHIWKPFPGRAKIDFDPALGEALFRECGRDLRWLALSGGEITLYPHLDRLFDSARQHCPELKLITFTTNGLRPDRAAAIAREIQRRGYDAFVTVSLDGDVDTHDHMRGIRGNHAKGMRTYELIRALGVSVHFGITLSPDNATWVEKDYAALAPRMKAVTFAHSGGIYRTETPSNSALMVRSLETVLEHYSPRSPGEVWEWLYLKLARRFFATNTVPVDCEVIETSLHVRPDGAVHPCMFTPAIGHLRDLRLREILDSETTRAARARIRAHDCPRCWMNCYAPHSMLLHPWQTLMRSGAGSFAGPRPLRVPRDEPAGAHRGH